MPDGNMPDGTDRWEIPDSELPNRSPVSNSVGQLMASGYKVDGSLQSCPRCGKQVCILLHPANHSKVICNADDGTLHATCRMERAPDPEPLPPVPTFQEQQEKLDRILGKKYNR